LIGLLYGMNSLIISNRINIFQGGVYFQMETGGDDAVYDVRFSLTFFSLLFITLVQQQTIPAYFEDKIIFDCERRPRIYSILPYWMASWLVYLPQLLFNTWFFGSVVYTMAGYRLGPAYYWFYVLILCLEALIGFGICQVVAVLSPTPQTAMSVFPVVVFSMMSVAGYFIYIKDLDNWLKDWAPFVSPMRYSFEALVLNELSGNNDLDDPGDFIEKYGFDTLSKGLCLVCAAICCGAIFVILIYAIKRKKKQRIVL
jgi:ABC-type multidrug transport system permease subunit